MEYALAEPGGAGRGHAPPHHKKKYYVIYNLIIYIRKI
jgi:hypothetical protein